MKVQERIYCHEIRKYGYYYEVYNQVQDVYIQVTDSKVSVTCERYFHTSVKNVTRARITREKSWHLKENNKIVPNLKMNFFFNIHINFSNILFYLHFSKDCWW